MIKKILAILGIGSASVDLALDQTNVEQGETVEGVVRVSGGWIDQEVQHIKYAVRSEYVVETDEGESYRTHTVTRATLADGFTIESGDEQSFDVAIDVGEETPTTLGSEEVWVDTALDIEWANDPEDSDTLQVQPGERLGAVFDALESLGFAFDSAENETASGTLYQELEFRARSGPFAGDLDELELLPKSRDDHLEIALEVDRDGGFISEMVGTDESHTSITVTDADPDAIEDDLRETIEEFS